MLAVMASAIITAVLIWFGIIYGIGVWLWSM
nr:MAG TPA: Intrinsic membrane protein PufX [Caudoviricetes sp.]